MSTLAVSNTFVAGNTITAAGHNQNFSDVVAWANGNVGETNLATLAGVVTWTVSSNLKAIDITNTGTEGSLYVAHNGLLASSKYGAHFSSSAASTAGAALVGITGSSASNTIPSLLVTDAGAGGSALTVASTTKGAIPAPKMTTTQRNAVASLVAGLQAFNTTTNTLQAYNGTAWTTVGTTLVVASPATTYTILVGDDLILADATSAAFTATLPASSGKGKVYKIKKVDAEFKAVTIARAGSDVIIDAGASVTSTLLHTQGEEIELVDAAAGTWHVLSRRIPSVWVAYTPTGNWTANTTYSGFWRREGDSMHCRVLVTVSGGAPTATFFDASIANQASYTIDTAKLPGSASGIRQCVGSAFAIDDATAGYIGQCTYNGSTDVAVVVNEKATILGTETAPFGFNGTGAGDFVCLDFVVPITGWNG